MGVSSKGRTTGWQSVNPSSSLGISTRGKRKCSGDAYSPRVDAVFVQDGEYELNIVRFARSFPPPENATSCRHRW